MPAKGWGLTRGMDTVHAPAGDGLFEDDAKIG